MKGSLIKKELLAESVYGFWFSIKKGNLEFVPGQFLKWTLEHQNPDDRGVERFFTISSSPHEKEILLATKIQENCSSYKKALKNLRNGDEIHIEGPYGDFLLPKEKEKEVFFIAGGIGVTPFRSMISHLLYKGESRRITLIYGVNSIKEIVFKDVFLEAERRNILKTVFVVGESDDTKRERRVERGQISKEIISKHISKIENTLFYVSGPRVMVEKIGNMLTDIGVEKGSIKEDFFPGYKQI